MHKVISEAYQEISSLLPYPCLEFSSVIVIRLELIPTPHPSYTFFQSLQTLILEEMKYGKR